MRKTSKKKKGNCGGDLAKANRGSLEGKKRGIKGDSERGNFACRLKRDYDWRTDEKKGKVKRDRYAPEKSWRKRKKTPSRKSLSSRLQKRGRDLWAFLGLKKGKCQEPKRGPGVEKVGGKSRKGQKRSFEGVRPLSSVQKKNLLNERGSLPYPNKGKMTSEGEQSAVSGPWRAYFFGKGGNGERTPTNVPYEHADREKGMSRVPSSGGSRGRYVPLRKERVNGRSQQNN